jgi:hypothetical protein
MLFIHFGAQILQLFVHPLLHLSDSFLLYPLGLKLILPCPISLSNFHVIYYFSCLVNQKTNS